MANDPAVRPWLGGAEGQIDLTPLIGNPANFTLVCPAGGFVVVKLDAGLYEVHSQFRPNSNAAIAAMRSGLEYMFLRTDCERLLTQVPDNNRAARGLARIGGFRETFRREDTPRGPTSFQAISIEEWVASNGALEAHGTRFHDQLERAKQANGSALVNHAYDPAHERAVGGTLRMILSGNALKGIRFYNRWALFAGYAPLNLVSEQPLTIDVVDAVVSVANGEMEFVLCR